MNHDQSDATPEEIARLLRRVISVCRTSAHRFHAAADEVEMEDVAAILERHAEQREGFIMQLEESIRENLGSTPLSVEVEDEDETSKGVDDESGGAHSPPGLLQRVIHQEQEAMRRYRKILHALPPGDTHDLVNQQLGAIEATRERLSELLDERFNESPASRS